MVITIVCTRDCVCECVCVCVCVCCQTITYMSAGHALEADELQNAWYFTLTCIQSTMNN